MNPAERERLGQVVRRAWVKWARRQPSPKPSWLLPWEELSEADREADRCIGEAVAMAVRCRDAIHMLGGLDDDGLRVILNCMNKKSKDRLGAMLSAGEALWLCGW